MGGSSDSWSGSKDNVADLFTQVNVPKTRRTYCKGKDCKKHTQHKVTQYKAGKVWIGWIPLRQLHQSDKIFRPPSSPRVSVVTTVSSPVTVVRPSRCSTRRPRLRRRSCSG